MITVIPARLEWLEALVEGDKVFASRFDIPVAAGWVGFPDALPYALEAARRNPDGDEWGAHLFFDHADPDPASDAHETGGTLVGFGGWKGPPVDGEAELGYAVAPSRQGRGIATAVVRQLVGRARIAGVRLVTAHTLDEPNASTSVLERCGFTLTAEVPDAELGTIWRWELPLRPDGEPGRRNVLEPAAWR